MNDKKYHIFLFIIISIILVILLSSFIFTCINTTVRGEVKRNPNLNYHALGNHTILNYIEYFGMTKNKGYVINMSNSFYVNGRHVQVIDFKDLPYYGFTVSPGDIVTVYVHLKNFENRTLYVYVYLSVDLDDFKYYLDKGIDIYRAYRGVEESCIPSNIIMLKQPKLLIMGPNASKDVILQFKISENTPQGIYPIEVSETQLYLINGTYYWILTDSLVYALKVS